MKIPLNDLSRAYQHHAAIYDKILTEVGGSGYYLNGPRVNAFAVKFAKYIGTTYCLPVGNGTDALELALRGAGVNAGDHILTVANAGGYTTTACNIIGAVPNYVDIDPDTLLIDLDQAVSLANSHTKAIVLTHLYGAVVDTTLLKKKLLAAGKDNIRIIEDSSQAHGAKIHDKLAGCFGDIATFSFYPTKNLGAFGDAGAIMCHDVAIFEKLKYLHQYGWSSKYTVSLPQGRNSRMDEIQAAILLARLPMLEEANQKRRNILDIYSKAAASSPISFPKRSGQTPAAHLAVAMVPHRDSFRAFLAKRGVATEIHYPVLDCDQPGWQSLPHLGAELPQSRRRSSQIVTLPCFPEMTAEEIQTVADALAAFYQ